MANKDDAKPVTGGYDFGDDWLNELEEALDFDMPQTDAQKALAAVFDVITAFERDRCR